MLKDSPVQSSVCPSQSFKGIKLIRKECSKRWPGNNKVYFRSNNANSLILSELVSSLEPICTLKKIGFGQSAIRNHILQWAVEKNRKLTDGYDFEKSRTPAKRALSSPTTDANESIDETDTETPSPDEACSSDGVNDISLLSFHTAHKSSVQCFSKSQPSEKMIQVAEGANFKCLSRNEVLIDRELDVLSVESSSSDRIDSSSGSTMSVDETDSGPDYDYDDEPEQAD
ncbi:uncharacterized protein [Montipora capricornis]|uniref:uncharacterized protein n=1 Tax=Montipora capricornis TaxID=246305 RepID=UPI0035F11016